jgi:hypothetical protein
MMCNNRTLRIWTMTAILFLLAGCSPPADSAAPTKSAKGEEEARSTFVAFQEALKAKDANKLWSLLDSDSRADAERKAKSVRDAYAKANAKERAEQEKTLGLAGAELKLLQGGGFLKSKRFLGYNKYNEIPGCKIDKIDVKGDKAVVHYIEDDGDKETLKLVREEGKWKVVAPMP